MQCNMECNSTDVMGMQLKRDIDRTIMYHHDHGGYLTAFATCTFWPCGGSKIPKVKAKVKAGSKILRTKYVRIAVYPSLPVENFQ